MHLVLCWSCASRSVTSYPHKRGVVTEAVMKIDPEKDLRVGVGLGDSDCEQLAKAGALTAPVKIQQILVPVDFSNCSKKALAYAVPFARQFGAQITLLHVVEFAPIIGTEFTEVDFTALEERARNDATAQLQKLASEQLEQGVRLRAQITSGRAWSEVVEVAKVQEIDLIVISTHGHTGLKHSLLGSIAEKVVRHAPCPVLVVRENEHEFL
jgi:universal stress protein A